MLRLRHLMPLVALAAAVFYAMPTPAPAQTIIDEWSSVKAPPAPALTSVTVDPKTTALLMLDFLKQNCGSNPRCVATLPKAQKLLAAARANNMTIIYSVFPGPVIGDTLPEVAPKGTEPVVTSFFNKFLDPNLDKVLKDKGIKTVILMGAASDGAILYTGLRHSSVTTRRSQSTPLPGRPPMSTSLPSINSPSRRSWPGR